jgi:hypothetical protein
MQIDYDMIDGCEFSVVDAFVKRVKTKLKGSEIVQEQGATNDEEDYDFEQVESESDGVCRLMVVIGRV